MKRFQIRDLIWLTLVVALLLGLLSCFKYVEMVKASNEVLRSEITTIKSNELRLNSRITQFQAQQSQMEKQMGSSQREQIISEFFSVRGYALLSLQRYEEATASFEIVHQLRPKDFTTLDQLIHCYEDIGNDPKAAHYRAKKQEVLDGFDFGGWFRDDLANGFQNPKRIIDKSKMDQIKDLLK